MSICFAPFPPFFLLCCGVVLLVGVVGGAGAASAVESPYSWSDGNSLCGLLGLGTLPVVANAADAAALSSFAVSSGLSSDFWIGLFELPSEEWALEWVDSSPLTYANFNAAGDNNAGTRDCVFASAAAGWAWEFGVCSDLKSVVCHLEAFPLPTTTTTTAGATTTSTSSTTTAGPPPTTTPAPPPPPSPSFVDGVVLTAATTDSATVRSLVAYMRLIALAGFDSARVSEILVGGV